MERSVVQGQAVEPDVLNARCPSRKVLELLADKWTLLVIAALSRGVRRNGQLLREVDGISQKMLTQTLRNLGAKGPRRTRSIRGRAAEGRVLFDAAGRDPDRTYTHPGRLGRAALRRGGDLRGKIRGDPKRGRLSRAPGGPGPGPS